MSGKDSEIVLKSSPNPELARIFVVPELILRNGKHEVVPLRLQSAKVLAVLISAEGKVVSKEMLVAEAWGKAAVTDDSITQCISDIRKALGEDGRQIVETHARKGYSLNRNIDLTKRNSSLRVWTIVAVAAALCIAIFSHLFPVQPTGMNTKPRIAVLAFEDFSPGPDQGYLSDAIAEGITAELARFSPFSTIARNSSFSLRGKDLSIEEIRDALQVDYVLEGSQQKLGENLVVTAQLIDTASGDHLWSETYDGALGDLFNFQTDIVRRVGSTVGGQLAVIPGRTGTRETVTAIHLAATGLRHQRKTGPENDKLARGYFEAAIKADPHSASGYLGMGFYYRNTAGYAETPDEKSERLMKAREFLSQAIELEPENYLTHYLMGHLHTDEGEFDLARARYESAKSLNPSFSNVFVGGAASLIYVGAIDAAIRDIRHGMAIDPLHPDWFHRYLAWALWSSGDCPGAKVQLDQMARRNLNALKTQAVVQICLGEIESAQSAALEAVERDPSLTINKESERLSLLWTDPGKLENWLNALRRAGLPE